MLMQEERELVVEYGKKMSAARLSTGTSGNISIYNAEKGLVALSPSGMDYFSTTPEDVVILDLDAKVVDGKRKPSSEWALHTTFYKHKPHARAVHHAGRSGRAHPCGALCHRRRRCCRGPLRPLSAVRHRGAGRGRYEGLRQE